MRALIVGMSLLCVLSLNAQNPAERFRAAEQQWKSHRPDETVWDDGSPEAAQALDEMWSAVTADANDYLLDHPTTSTAQLKMYLENLTPVIDPRFGNGLLASVATLGERLYVVSFSDGPASTVFVLRPQDGAAVAWRISEATTQAKDAGNLLRAWQSSRADEKCSDREPNSIYVSCGPLTSSIGILPKSGSGSPRFYIDATYSKDAGASFADQLSIWEWEGSAPALLWIGRYIDHTEATRPQRVHGSSLSFGTQADFETFFACMSCDGRQLVHRLRLTADGVIDQGETILYPELDRVDALFVALAKRRPTKQLASPKVADALRDNLRRAAAKSAKTDPNWISVGMLEGWSVTRGDRSEETICIITDDLGRLDFTYDLRAKGGGLLTTVTRNKNSSTACPTKNAIHLPYSSTE